MGGSSDILLALSAQDSVLPICQVSLWSLKVKTNRSERIILTLKVFNTWS